jgi:hypothetical protein
MPITNPEAIGFCNNQARKVADLLSQAYYAAKAANAVWVANNYGGALITVGGGVVRDSASPTDDNGTGGDGRPVITGNDVNNLMNRMSELIADYEASGNAKLNTILNVAVNPTRNS